MNLLLLKDCFEGCPCEINEKCIIINKCLLKMNIKSYGQDHTGFSCVLPKLSSMGNMAGYEFSKMVCLLGI